MRPDGDVWLVESPLCGARIVLPRLAALDDPLVRRALAAAGFLDAPSLAEDDPRAEVLEPWEFQDLLFHTHHRRGSHRDPFGARYPFMGEIDPPPARRPEWTGERIPLTRAADPSHGDPFAVVLERRRSERRYRKDRLVAATELGALLDRAARIRSLRTVEVRSASGRPGQVELSQRPYPSAGATHPLEIYPVVAQCRGLAPGVYHYDAFRHALVRIAPYNADAERVVADAKLAIDAQADPQVVLVIAARFARALWKYRSIGYANILRDTGALYQTLYLAATELELAACAVGTGHAALFGRITGLDPLAEGTVGEFLIGGRTTDLPPVG